MRYTPLATDAHTRPMPTEAYALCPREHLMLRSKGYRLHLCLPLSLVSPTFSRASLLFALFLFRFENKNKSLGFQAEYLKDATPNSL